ncbi:M1 family metallopeptidase [Candidatus Parcubacteria bacterium]|nr:M1 family metallopeptidase [Candidatus Parcubacteria bacterium]
MAKKVIRLFDQFQPENYRLEMDIDKANLKFSGKVVIKGRKTGRPSQRLSFHQKDLKINSAKIIKHDKKGDAGIIIERINAHKSFQEVRLHSQSMIYPGNYTVTLEFSGKITDIMVGLYPCYFKNKGQQDWLVATQFESHHAREAFPCIDEPEAKATFDLTIITPKNQTVLSNMPVKSQKLVANRQSRVASKKKRPETNDKRLETEFERTPVMSSYLLAWVIGDMNYKQSKTKNGIEVRIWASSAQPESFLTYALEEAIKIQEFFAEYFQTPFPLKKMDHVALPDFEVGAMENWGLITYREAALLADPVNRSISTEQHVSLVVAHELSHQWFGNLVTMKWWDDLWLNESFASIMEHIALDNLHPDWHQWEDFTSADVISASNRDNYLDVQPVSLEVKHPDEIHTLFDGAIVYAKGARLLKMLYDYVGEEAIRNGLKNYFDKYAYKNTVRSDLWDEFSQASKQDIDSLMTPWLIKSGMPVIKISRKGNQLHLSQKRFLLAGEDDVSLWPIPLLSDKKLAIDVLDKKSASVEYKDEVEPVLNQAGSGHFVVNYTDQETKDNIKQKLIKQEIPSTGRINVLNDMLLLTQKGDFKLADIIDIVDECDREPREAVWSMLYRAIYYGSLLTEGDDRADAQIKSLKVKLSAYWYGELGWDDETHDDPNTKLLRQTALGLSVSGENKLALDEALKRFKACASVDELPSEQRGMIAGAAVRFSKQSDKIIDSLMKQYEETPNPDVQHSISAALCSTRKPEQARRIIKWGLAKNGAVRAQDLARWYALFMRNKYVRNEVWEWLKANWDERYEELGGPKTLPYFVRFAAGTITTQDRYDEFKQFFEPKLADPGLTRDIKVAFSTIESQIAWRSREESDLKKYLSKYP